MARRSPSFVPSDNIGVPLAVATSLCWTFAAGAETEAVQVMDLPGARVVAGQVAVMGSATSSILSSTTIPVMSTMPVLVTR